MAQRCLFSGKHVGLALRVYQHVDGAFLVHSAVVNSDCKLVGTHYLIGCHRDCERAFGGVLGDVAHCHVALLSHGAAGELLGAFVTVEVILHHDVTRLLSVQSEFSGRHLHGEVVVVLSEYLELPNA